MAHIVVLYATTDGQTGRIARHVAAALGAEGMDAQVVDAAAPPPPFSFAGADAAVVAGSIRMGKHQRALTHLVRARAARSRYPPLAVQMAKKALGNLSGRSVLLVGAGEMAQLAARELHACGAAELLVVNRSEAHGEALAAKIGGLAVGLAGLPGLLERADVVICSTGAQHPVVTREVAARALKASRYRPLFLIDLALPRNVDPAVNDLENAYVYDLDDLERVAAENRRLREQEQQRAEAIVREELVAYAQAKRERAAIPVLARLRAEAQAVAESELERTLAVLEPLGDRQRKSVRAMANAIVNKLLHGPTARLRGEQGGPLADAAAELFGLEAA